MGYTVKEMAEKGMTIDEMVWHQKAAEQAIARRAIFAEVRKRIGRAY